MFRCTIPEGPEILLSKDAIKPLLINQKVTQIKIGEKSRYRRKPLKGLVEFQKAIDESLVISNVETRGKFMYWSFSNDWFMFCGFGMSGQWSPNPGEHCCIEVKMIGSDGAASSLYFDDPRHFGNIQFVKGERELLNKLDELGWDPLYHGYTEAFCNFIYQKCQRKDKPIGQLLMDQAIFSGVGNYIRAEVLYEMKMSPWRKSKDLSKADVLSLCQTIIKVMTDSYQHQGATILTYKDPYGSRGKYSDGFKVYRQSTDPLGNQVITEETPDGRTIHWCPAVQV